MRTLRLLGRFVGFAFFDVDHLLAAFDISVVILLHRFDDFFVADRRRVDRAQAAVYVVQRNDDLTAAGPFVVSNRKAANLFGKIFRDDIFIARFEIIDIGAVDRVVHRYKNRERI